MKTKSLLSHLTQLETSLSNFSYEELSAADASQLRQTFLSFKKLAEARFWGETAKQQLPATPVFYKGASADQVLKKELELVAMVSHEIRIPIRGISDLTEILKESGLTPEQESHVNAIEAATRHIFDTTGELLEYASTAAGLEKPDSIPFNFHGLIREVTYLCETLILEKGVRLDIHIDPAVPKHVKGDPSRIIQVLLSLLGNAIGSIKQGAVALHVLLSEHSKGVLRLKFVVSDTGIGIPENDLNHLFTSFRQAGNATYQKNGGSGLGLAIVKQLVGLLGGEITVSSTLGQGTTFTFVLPLEKAVMPESPQKPHASVIDRSLPPNGQDIAIDLLPMLQDCLGKVEILEDLVALFKQNALEFIGTVKVCLAKTNFEGIAFATNKIMCTIKMFRTENLGLLVTQMHKISRMNQDIRQLKFLHECFVEEYPVVEAALDAALAEIKDSHP